ncbi:MAG: hypothetical protein HN564_00620 [Flavobacteriales bacterium]|jgi:hypothetical protein|nr:hypothetical protein [Flavobacteriales bacterium]
MKKLITLLFITVLISNTTKAQESHVFADYSMLEVEFYENGEGELKSKNITSYVMGISSIVNLSERMDLIGTAGISKGFDYTFISSNLSLELTSNFNLSLGGGLYNIADKIWVTNGLDGEQPSSLDFGLNFGLACQLSETLGVSVRYNIIEPKEDYENGSMSINGLAFGIILK